MNIMQTQPVQRTQTSSQMTQPATIDEPDRAFFYKFVNSLKPATDVCDDYSGPWTPETIFHQVSNISSNFDPSSWEHYVQFLLPLFSLISPVETMATARSVPIMQGAKCMKNSEVLAYPHRIDGLKFLDSFQHTTNGTKREYTEIAHPITSFSLSILRSDDCVILRADHPVTGNSVSCFTCIAGTICLQSINSNLFCWCDISKPGFDVALNCRIQFYYINGSCLGSCEDVWTPGEDPIMGAMNLYFRCVIMASQ